MVGSLLIIHFMSQIILKNSPGRRKTKRGVLVQIKKGRKKKTSVLNTNIMNRLVIRCKDRQIREKK